MARSRGARRSKPLAVDAALRLLISGGQPRWRTFDDVRRRLDVAEYSRFLKAVQDNAFTSRYLSYLRPRSVAEVGAPIAFRSMALERELRWAHAVVASDAQFLDAVYRLTKVLEISLLADTYPAALHAIEAFEREHGPSIWLTKTKLYVIGRMQGFAAQRTAADRILNDIPGRSGRLAYVTHFASRRNDPGHVLARLRDLRDGTVREIQDPVGRGYAEFHLLWPEVASKDDAARILAFEASSTRTDMALSLRCICRQLTREQEWTPTEGEAFALTAVRNRHQFFRTASLSQLYVSGDEPVPRDGAESADHFYLPTKGALERAVQHEPSDVESRDVLAMGIQDALARRFDTDSVGSFVLMLISVPFCASTDLLTELVAHLDSGVTLAKRARHFDPQGVISALMPPRGPGDAPAQSSGARFGTTAPRIIVELLDILTRLHDRVPASDLERLLSLCEHPSAFVAAEAGILAVRSLLQQKESSLAARTLVSLATTRGIPATTLPLRSTTTTLVAALRSGYAEPDSSSATLLFMTENADDARGQMMKHLTVERAIKQLVGHPSELVHLATVTTDIGLLHFLALACTEEVLQDLPDIEDSDSALRLRLSLCETVAPRLPQRSDSLAAEAHRLRARIRVSEGLRDARGARVFVNEERLAVHLVAVLQQDYARLVALAEAGLSPIDEERLQTALRKAVSAPTSQGLVVVLPETEFTTALEKLAKRVRDEFVSSTAYGLNGYLSTRIRHGTLKGHLRRALQDAGLVTEKNEATGHYAPANRWRRPILAHSASVAEQVNSCLADFARKVDVLIDEVKLSWVVVALDDAAPGFFRFPIDRRLLDAARNGFGTDSSLEKVVAVLLGQLHSTLEECLTEIRNAFEVTLTSRASDLIASLRASLSGIQVPAGLTEAIAALHAAVDAAAVEWHRDILEASLWFALERRAGGSTFTAADAAHIAESTLARSGRRFTLELYDGADACSFPASSERSLVDIFELLFDNAYRRSGFHEDTRCIVRLSCVGRRVRIEMTNAVSPHVDTAELEQRVRDLTAELRSEEILRRASVDTRSGYPKICNILRHELSWSHSLQLNFDRGSRVFSVALELEVPS